MTWDGPETGDFQFNEDDEMAGLTDPLSADVNESPARSGGKPVRRSLDAKVVCPFCGSVNTRSDEPCPSCGMENTPATRNSTRGRVGPWYVLQKRNPAAPGMKFETLIKFIREGRIQPKAILRGPTTSQLWRFASSVKGVSREFGLCYNCGGDVDPAAELCSHCGRDQQPPVDPNALLETRVNPAPRPRPQSQPVKPGAIEAADAEDVVLNAAPEPVVSKPAVKPVTPGVAAFNSAAPISQPEPSRFPPASSPDAGRLGPVLSREERERREIEAGREAREAEPRDPNKPAPTLSARELATAFQLDFTPTDRKRRGKSRKGLLAFLFLLALGGAGTVAWFNVPQFHDQVLQAYTLASGKIQTLLNPPAPSATKPVGPRPFVPDTLTLQGTGPRANPPAAQPPTLPNTPVVAPGAPAVVAPGGNTPAPSVAGPATPSPSPAVKPAAPPAPKMTIDEAYEASRKLWRQALDKEAAGDWVGAVAAYQQIKSLPPKAQQTNLDLRLSEARAHLGQ